MKYEVRAKMTSYSYLTLEADSQEEAIEKAKEIDGGEFIEDDPREGEWEIIDAVPVEEEQTYRVLVDVYKDSTGMFSDCECDINNIYTLSVPRKILAEWVKEKFNKELDSWLNEYTCDDTHTLFNELKDRIRYSEPYKYGKKLFRYDYNERLVEWIHKPSEDELNDNKEWQEKYQKDLWEIVDGYVVVDRVGLRMENWDNVESRKSYLQNWCDDIEEETQIELSYFEEEFK